MEVIEDVKITQFINPHLFWLQKTSNDCNFEFIRFKEELNRHYKQLFSTKPYVNCKLRVGDHVACLSKKEKTWFRAEIDHIYQDTQKRENNIVVWLMDCGRSVEAHSDFIRPLDEKFLHLDFKHIFKAGISCIVAAEREFDFRNNEARLVASNSWSQRTLGHLTDFLDDVPEMNFHVNMVDRNHNHLFGDLMCKSYTSEVHWIRKKLLTSSCALPVAESEFMEALHAQAPNVFSIPRFRNNEGFNVWKTNTLQSEVVFNSPVQPVSLSEDAASNALVSKWLKQNEEKQIQKTPEELMTENEEGPPPLLSEILESQAFMSSKLTNSNCSDTSSVRSEPRLPRGVSKENMPESKPEQDSERDLRSRKKLDRLKALQKAQIKDESQKQQTIVNFKPAEYIGALELEKLHSNKGSVDKSGKFNQVARRAKKQQNTFPKYLKDHDVEKFMGSNEFREHQNLIDANLNEQVTFHEITSKTVMAEDHLKAISGLDHVIVHGKSNRPPLTYTSYKEANFTNRVSKLMAQITDQPRRLQSYVWPHLMKESSAIIIGSPETGKTFSYLPAICSHIEFIVNEGELTVGEGPIAIFILSSADDVSKVQKICQRCLPENQPINMLVVAHGMFNREKVEAQLLHGAGLLLTTPPCLSRLLMCSLPLIKREKLKMIVVDNYDTCVKRFGSQTDDLLEKLYVRPLDEKDPPQVVITSSEWNQNLIKYSSLGKNCALFLASYTESAIYGFATVKLRVVDSKFKVQVLYESHLKSQEYKQKRTVIVCRDDNEVLELFGTLMSEKPDVCMTPYVLKSTSDANEGVAALNWFKQKNPGSVLIVSDESLGDLRETKNARVLINFSTATSWSKLTKRFSVLFDSYHNYFIKRREPEGFVRPQIFIFVNETDDQECFPKLERFMRRICKPPKEFSDMADCVLKEQDKQHKSIRLCNNLLHFGECLNMGTTCCDRHTLQQSDKPSVRMPAIGKVLKLKITEVHTPIHYSARILASQEIGQTRWTEHEHYLVELELKLQLYYSDDKNLKTASDVKKGEIYTWSGQSGRFHRVKVLGLNKRGLREDKESEVMIQFIDSGHVERHLKGISYLLEIPDDLKTYPPAAVDIHYSGIVPFDGDIIWDRETSQTVMRLLNKHQSSGGSDHFVQVQVTYVLEGHIWTNKVSIVKFLKEVRQNDIIVVHQKMLQQNLCEKDKEERGLKAIKNMALKIDLFDAAKEENHQVPAKTSVPEPVLPKESLHARGTFDYLDSEKIFPINIQRIDEEGTFYFYRLDRNEQFKALLQNIDNFTAEKSNLTPLESIENGKNCLALLDDGYTRVRIIGPGKENGSYSCYLLDLGEIDELPRESFVETTNEITKMAPFFAIRGSLFGVVPVGESSFSGMEVENMKRKLLESSTEIYARLMERLPNTDFWNEQWGLNFYDLLLLCFEGDKLVVLNEDLCDKGIGKVDPVKDFKMLDLNALRKELENNEDDWDDWENDVGSYQPPKPLEGSKSDPLSNLAIDDLDHEDLKNLCKMFGLNLDEVEKKQENNEESQSLKPEAQKPKPKATKPKKSLSEKAPPKCTLKQIYKSPNVVWHQNEELIMLYIAVGDVEEYFLEVTPKDLIFQIMEPTEGEPRVLVLNFFGVVDVPRVSHKKCGLNVVVRVPKLGFSEWPRLVWQKEKLMYLKYNLETIHLKEDYILPKKRKLKRKNANFDDYDDDDDDESTFGGLDLDGDEFEVFSNFT